LINDTKVEPRRVVAKNKDGEPVEVLFVHRVGMSLDSRVWEVLAPTRSFKGYSVIFPEDISAKIIVGGRPQHLELSRTIDESYFLRHGEMPLPPYIQKMREKISGSRMTKEKDAKWYQTAWAKVSGSSAAPTASLHFEAHDIVALEKMGVEILNLTLHVGLGTYLPLAVDDLKDHKMHTESVHIPWRTIKAIQEAKKRGARIWALGTTAARSAEAWACGHLQETETGAAGETDLLIQEGFEWKVVNGLLTNFHQPESTLLALVCGFAGRERVVQAYRFAIQNRFRLFSYGDLSVWTRHA
jgi:S-adenosylmethionine:tRNA ribosyltransferase-isomerase